MRSRLFTRATLPVTTMSWPSTLSSAASRPSRAIEVFCQSARSRVVLTTSFGMPFIRSAIVPVSVGQYAACSR
jgi:hypothetical protein